MTRWLNIVLAVALLMLLPGGAQADSDGGYETGKFKVRQNRCYQEFHWYKKGLVWEEFDCINFMEHSSFGKEILFMLKIHSDNLRKGALSKEQYLEIVQKNIIAWEISLGSNPGYEQIRKNLREDEEKILGRPYIRVK